MEPASFEQPRLPALAGRQLTFVTVAAEQAAEKVAGDVAERLRRALALRGRAVLHVSGGKSPVALFQALQRQALDWSKVQVSLADERCVPADHADSNAALVRQHLLQGQAAQAGFVPLVPEAAASWPPLEQLAEAAGQALRAQGPADVLILGMGTDGHTASIFPGMAELARALDVGSPQVCLPVPQADVPGAAHARITQGLAHLLTARHIVLPLAGPHKLQVLRQACEKLSLRWPISFILHQTRAPVAVWIAP